mmetsp:Transcript_21007/g.34724  ORF Transcript_21007/g.34724 Transcript_21007/m.34724 type:complete len:248 (-) Transcript_21007:1497-2240(-)
MIAANIIVLSRILRVFLPIIHINHWHSAHQQLQLLEIENRQERFWNNIKETKQQLVELWFHAVQHSVLETGLHVLWKVLVRDFNVGTIPDQLNLLLGSHDFLCRGEIQAKHLNVFTILGHSFQLFQVIVILLVNHLQVTKVDRPAQNMFVEMLHHVTSHQLSVKESLTHNTAQETIVNQVILTAIFTRWIDFHTHLISRTALPQTHVWIENLFRHQLEPFSRQSTSINAHFTNKLESPQFAQILSRE